MPSIIDKFRVGKGNDRRRKLTDEDREKIKQWYRQGIAIREITRRIDKVDRQAIKYFLFPEFRERQHLRLKAHNYYYNKKKHKIYMRRHRQYKKELFNLEN